MLITILISHKICMLKKRFTFGWSAFQSCFTFGKAIFIKPII